MKFLIIIILTQFPIFLSDNWYPGETDSKGNLIIVEFENKVECKDRSQHQVITVDMDWSILIIYNEVDKPQYFIFNNIRNEIFKTESFIDFLKEIKQIPDSITIRNIEKCSVPFSYMMPEKDRDKLNKIIEDKNCILEEKIMYCYCCALKINYKFLK